MIFRGPNDFAEWVRGAGLVNVAPEVSKMIVCLDEYARMCACDPPQIKTAQYNRCKELYISFVVHAVAYKAQLLAKTKDNSISFYNGSQMLITIAR